jgi:hypothetical protein
MAGPARRQPQRRADSDATSRAEPGDTERVSDTPLHDTPTGSTAAALEAEKRKCVVNYGAFEPDAVEPIGFTSPGEKVGLTY